MAQRNQRSLPSFPWDSLTLYADTARAHPDGIVDLSVGTPVDATPDVVQQALANAANSPGYPTTAGTPKLRQAVVSWLARRFGIRGVDPDGVLPTIGSKELVAWLPTLLDLGPGHVVVHPELAYPTYDIGARLAGATPIPADDPEALDDSRLDLVWLNSPANPHGRVLAARELEERVNWARDRRAVLASDECYLEFGWDPARPYSVLHPDVNGGSLRGLLSVHSLSKRSNLAGYRAGFVVGDPVLVGRLLEKRKHAGMIVPGPVQSAMVAALNDDEHVNAQRERYEQRRAVLRPALEAAGFRMEHSNGGLYLWATRGEPCGVSVMWLAKHGILVAPGEFYGQAGSNHVRVALTATDERVAAAAARLHQAR